MTARSSRTRSRINPLRLLPLLLLPLLFAQPACAFYSWEDEANSVELRGMVQGTALALRNPDAPLLYDKRSVAGAAGSIRLMLDADVAQRFSFEVHALQSYVPTELLTGGSRLAPPPDVERSGSLDWSFDRRRAHLLFDRLNFQYASPRLNLKVGRQPVNLAATFYFTPNDFFAPFAAQTFFRDYKPGVDAARADIRMAELSQLSLISVLGYRADAGSDNGWSNRYEASRNAYLARASAVFGDFELALLGGTVRRDRVAGMDFQGELFEWLGVRGEGHLLWPDSPLIRRQAEVALGVDHRWENSFTIRLEQFYHGAGATSAAAYSVAPDSGMYLGRLYSAAGAGYEFSPLLTGDATVIYNWTDRSSLVALYALYSLSDESVLACSGTMATGRKPLGANIRSEFGLYGDSVSIEYRGYF